MSQEPLRITDLKDIKFLKRGKVRDVYDLGDKLLIISTDRISCFDVILPTSIPHKGEILTRLSLFWFELTKGIVNNHLITADVREYPRDLQKYRDMLEGRSMIVKKAQSLPVECIVRGYISGSGWKEYKEKGSICGVNLPNGLKESDKLPEPIFTPSTKEEVGHDINVSEAHIAGGIGKEATEKIKQLSLAIYKKAAGFAEHHGIIIADTKFEFGIYKDEIILIDEVLTPDSSRFWPMDKYKPGGPQASFDKQYVRDYLESLDWNKEPPAPELPGEVVRETTDKYYRMIELFLAKHEMEKMIEHMDNHHDA